MNKVGDDASGKSFHVLQGRPSGARGAGQKFVLPKIGVENNGYKL
jgi:hypothetical protein